MKHLKSILIDLLVTAVILWTVFSDAQWGRVALWIYTPLMILIKVGALTMGRQLTRQVKPDETPVAIYHVLYAVNVAALLWDRWWIMAGLWVAVWVLSGFHYVAFSRTGSASS